MSYISPISYVIINYVGLLLDKMINTLQWYFVAAKNVSTPLKICYKLPRKMKDSVRNLRIHYYPKYSTPLKKQIFTRILPRRHLMNFLNSSENCLKCHNPYYRHLMFVGGNEMKNVI
jgi:hypothetical protein